MEFNLHKFVRRESQINNCGVKKIFIILTTLLFTPSFAVGQSLSPTMVVADELFVRWRNATPATRDQAYRALGAEVVWESSLVPGLQLIRLNDSDDLTRAWETLRTRRDVIYSEPNFVENRKSLPKPSFERDPVDIFGVSAVNDPRHGEQWSLNGEHGMKVTQAWEKLPTLKEVIVGIIDTGIDAVHPDLAGRVGAGYDFIDETDVVRDVGGHGSHVAGIIGATINNGIGVSGIASNVTMLPIRAVPDSGDETDLHVIRSIEFAVEKGAKIINCSFGKAAAGQAVAEAFLAAGERGVLAVVAAGNNNANLDNQPMYPASFHTPNMLVVGSMTKSGTRSSFSNISKTGVDVFAPGSAILSTVPDGGYASYSGTSMASPAAAGVAALIMGMRPELLPTQVRELLKETSRKMENLREISVSGGIVDASLAVDAAHGF
jgi:thermitase